MFPGLAHTPRNYLFDDQAKPSSEIEEEGTDTLCSVLICTSIAFF